MATAILTTAAQAVVTGKNPLPAVGQAVGSSLVGMVGARISGPIKAPDGPRLANLELRMPEEGAPIPVVEGFMRVTGRVIWADDIVERSSTETSGGGKGQREVEATTDTYHCTFAVGIADCTHGAVRHLGRVWADDTLLDLAQVAHRFHRGTEGQEPDPAIVAKDGVASAYRGTCYIVFENFDLTEFGNRVPQFSFEIFGPSGEMETLIQGVDIIPGSTEWGYEPEIVEKDDGGETEHLNGARHNKTSDWRVSMDHLQGVLPNCGTAALVVAWFGTDLRAGRCLIEPRVETRAKDTEPRDWRAGGRGREEATLVTQVDGSPAYGSSPDDQSIINAIRDLKERGLRTVLYPFIMMDIAKDSALPDPSGDGTQPAYPWRGRVRSSAADGPAATQVGAFMGSAAPGDFSTADGVPPRYSGPDEWSYRRFILHLAALARSAGGVDAFLIGSEMVGLTTSTDAPGVYPFVDALVELAADVRTMLPDAQARLSYAADWSEYHSHRSDGDVHFHLDPLWSSPHIDFVAIDNYLPLSDWREGTDHLDFQPEKSWTSVYGLDYLKANIEGGEYHDWYYASDADRRAQVRTPIQDGAHGEHWVFRQKAIRDWHGNAHHDRANGVRSARPTGWTPGSKPIWFTEIGCGAVDLGTNQPNKFLDPKSSESTLPHFSRGVRDDFMARQYTRAVLEWWRDNGAGVVDPADILVWAWDARPWPEFPTNGDTWSDAENWTTGHWLNGRAGAAPVAEMTGRWMRNSYGFASADFDVSEAYGQVDGLLVTEAHSLREVLRPAEILHGLTVFERDGRIQFRGEEALPRRGPIAPEELVQTEDGPSFTVARAARDETPRSAQLDYIDVEREYEPGSVRASLLDNPGSAELRSRLAVASSHERMKGGVEAVLLRAAQSAEELTFSLPGDRPIAAGEVFEFPDASGRPKTYRVDEVTRGSASRVRAASVTERAPAEPRPERRKRPRRLLPSRRVTATFLDLPLLPMSGAADTDGFVAVHAAPWPGGVDLYRSREPDTGFEFVERLVAPGALGRTVSPLPTRAPARWTATHLDVELRRGQPVSRGEEEVLAGKNALAVEHAPGRWEVLQFQDAELLGPKTWRLTRLIRGQLGTEVAMPPDATPDGARVVLLDGGVTSVPLAAGELGVPFHWKCVPVGEDMTDPRHVAVQHAFRGIGRRPYAPAHLEASEAGGTISARWLRRTRVEGDVWPDGGTVPLGEASERYLVEFRTGAETLLGVETGSPAIEVATPDVRGEVEIVVSQISERFGPGPAVRTTLALQAAPAAPPPHHPDLGKDTPMPTHSLELPLLSASQAQKHVTVNAALTRLDRLVQLAVRSRGLSSPPAAPAEGDAYIVGTTPSGDWLGHENAVAVFDGDAWDVHAPAPGWLAYVADEDAYCRFAGQWDAVAFVGGGT